jgi:hypothetical protein
LSAPDIPTDYTVASTINGTLDVGLDDIRIKELPTITLDTNSTLNSTSTLTSSSTVDLGLDNIRIRELPAIDLRLQTSMKPARLHFPVNVKFAVCTLGSELLSFTICGESMVVIEDFTRHRTEECV